MNSRNIYIKLKKDCEPIKYFEWAYRDREKSYFYNLNEKSENELNIAKTSVNSEYYLIALIHDKDKIIAIQ